LRVISISLCIMQAHSSGLTPIRGL
jgi:hypothetical protein